MGLLFSGNLHSSNGQLVTREAVVAGSFYPGNASELRETLGRLFSDAPPGEKGADIQAVIAPHAGYVYSGLVAAAAYNQIDKASDYKNIFILASSHHASFGKASIYNLGNYSTPLGEVMVNINIANELIDNYDCFTFYRNAHAREHSIEVQLPFLQYYFPEPIPIIPIVLGTHSPEICREIAEALSSYFNKDNLFVVSADFSHYPDYLSAKKVDSLTAESICSGSPEKFLATIKSNSELKIPGLATSMCAWPAGLSLLYLAENQPGLQFRKVFYQNSGDSKVKAGRSEVVGYNAIVLARDKAFGESGFSYEERNILLGIARKTLNEYIPGWKTADLKEGDFGPALRQQTGAFVSLKKAGKLRGCIGTFRPDEPLYKLIQLLTISSATEDTRFLPVQAGELDDITIEISVLTPLKKIKNVSEICLGKHGIYLKKNGHSGTFLPQVAVEQGWSLEEFLGRCARDKAGLMWDEWKEAEIFIFEAIACSEK